MGAAKKGLFEQALELDYITVQQEQPQEDKPQEAQPPKEEKYSVHKQFLFQPSTNEALKAAAKAAGVSENKYINWLVKQHIAQKAADAERPIT